MDVGGMSNVVVRSFLEGANVVFCFIYIHLYFLWPLLDATLLFWVSLVRLGVGRWVAEGTKKSERPAKLLRLYECESDQESRIVRETLSVLDLDYISYPCPRESMSIGSGQLLNSRYRADLVKAGGLQHLPFLIDENTSPPSKMYTSNSIAFYLWQCYGASSKPSVVYRFLQSCKTYNHSSLFLCQLLRPCMWMGVLRAPSRLPEEPIEIWGYESCPKTRNVREVLSKLELPHVMHTSAKGSSKVDALREELKKGGEKMGVVLPFMKDSSCSPPTLLAGRSDIVKYLENRYMTYPVETDSWLDNKGDGPEFSHAIQCLPACVALAVTPVAVAVYVLSVVFQLM